MHFNELFDDGQAEAVFAVRCVGSGNIRFVEPLPNMLDILFRNKVKRAVAASPRSFYLYM